MVWGRFDNLRTGESWQFDQPARILTAPSIGEVAGLLAEVDSAARQGMWAYGFVSYEATTAFDRACLTHAPDPSVPLAWFALTTAPHATPLADRRPGSYALGPWRWHWTPAEHASQVAAVRAAIAAGETYQCNLTTRLTAPFTGDPWGWYRDLAAAQQGGHHAYLDCGDLVIVSASPESFLTVQGNRATSVPMKGTAPRSTDPRRDATQRAALLASDKERSENVMIVDLIRNDLSRVAVPGTVTVSDLLCCEEYSTVWQLTSTVSVELLPGTGLVKLFTAMFPCGSITGAPKPRTTRLITELEDGPRGVYCGAVGWVGPPTLAGGPPQARFNVAIRTGVVDRRVGTVSYGVGGGITWSSNAVDEYAELQAKARILDPPAGLIETIAVRGGVPSHLPHHLARLIRSAAALGIVLDEAHLRALVDEASVPGPDRILRVELAPDGLLSRTERELSVGAEPVRLAIDEPSVDPTDRLFGHKTTRRAPYERARARHPYVDDVVLVNTAGLVTETTIATLLVRFGDTWCTPPVSDGCLAGVGREILLAQGEVVERSIPIELLMTADEVAVVSSVRGWRPAVLIDPASAHGSGAATGLGR